MTLCAAAITVLTTADPAEKVALSRRFAEEWRTGAIAEIGRRPHRTAPPAQRSRNCCPPATCRPAGKAAAPPDGRRASRARPYRAERHRPRLGHRRPASEPICPGFSDDWVQVADDEARHFDMLSRLLANLGSYGALPAHDGLWQSSQDTTHDLAARLAAVVLEARGLDVTPAMILNLRRSATMPRRMRSRSSTTTRSPMSPPADAGSSMSARRRGTGAYPDVADAGPDLLQGQPEAALQRGQPHKGRFLAAL